MRPVLLLLLAALSGSCSKNRNTDGSEIFFQVQIKSLHDMNCGLPEINFLTNQDKAYEIIGDKMGTYIAYGLSKTNYKPGDKLWVRIRKPKREEFVVCRAFGPSWHEVTITEIK